MSTDISVVVCAYDEARWSQIGETLKSLAAQTIEPREVIVVVDHNERLLERVRAELGALAVENRHAPGLCGTRNSAVEAASGSVVAFLDDDAVASPEWLALLQAHYANEHVAGVGGSAAPQWATRRPAWFPPEFDWVIGCSYLGMPEQPQEVRNLFGCNMSFRRSLVQAAGGFRLGYSCDETELCIRLTQCWPEKQLIYVPEASVAHYVPPSRARLRRFLSRCYFEGGSKAVVARLVGATEGLESERAYTLNVLPRGVGRGIADFLKGDPNGLARAGVILAGLLSTAAGYATARVSMRRAARKRGWSGELRRSGPAKPQLAQEPQH